MAFFDDLSKKVSKFGQDVSQKTQSFTDSVKINNQINEQRRNLSGAFEELGRMLYKEESVQANPNCRQLLDRIAQGEQNLKSLEQQLSVAKGMQPCKNCGAMVPIGNAFCQNCGTRVAPEPTGQQNPASQEQPAGQQNAAPQAEQQNTYQEVQPNTQQGRICPNCGQPVEGDSAFCTHCGQPVSQ